VPVSFLYFPGPDYKVFRSLSSRLRHNPKFKILWSVIMANPVLVVDILSRNQSTTKDTGHHKTMLEYPFTISEFKTVSLPCPLQLSLSRRIFVPSTTNDAAPGSAIFKGQTYHAAISANECIVLYVIIHDDVY
jgi:hypothetical protein